MNHAHRLALAATAALSLLAPLAVSVEVARADSTTVATLALIANRDGHPVAHAREVWLDIPVRIGGKTVYDGNRLQ